MSLRRKSCNACFRGRRKCDRTFPVCQRCAKTGKSCQYVPEPTCVAVEHPSSSLLRADNSTDPNNKTYTISNESASHTSQLNLTGEPLLDSDLQNFYFDLIVPESQVNAPNLLGELGDLSPLHGDTESWNWAIAQLQACLENFAKAGENLFIHRTMYRDRPPAAIKAVFGICAASQMVTPATKAIFISSLEGEVSTLLSHIEVDNVAEGLARLQAIVLYQILRLFSRDETLQKLVEQQKSAINAWALHLLQRIQIDSLSSPKYEDLILAESIRRTVVVIYLLHAIDTIFKYGVCTELPTLALLPVSVSSEVWQSSSMSDTSLAGDKVGTMKYGDWTDMWVSFQPRRPLDAFQRVLMVACKRKAKVEELETGIV